MTPASTQEESRQLRVAPAQGLVKQAAATHMQCMSERADTPRAVSCPICGNPVVEGFLPFCGRRCADVDLNRWLSGVYAVPVEAEDGAAPERPAPASSPGDPEVPSSDSSRPPSGTPP